MLNPIQKRDLLTRILKGDKSAMEEAQFLAGPNPFYALSTLEREIFLKIDYGYFPHLAHLDEVNPLIWPGAVIDWATRHHGEPGTMKTENGHYWDIGLNEISKDRVRDIRGQFRNEYLKAISAGTLDRRTVDESINRFREKKVGK